LSELSWELEGLNIEMFIAPGVIDVAGPRLQLRPVAGLSVIHGEKPKYHGAKQFEKRLFDAVFSSLVLFVGLPILIGIAIKLTSPGTVFYRQERIGADGRPFEMIKFRTMVDGADAMLGGLVSLNESPGGVDIPMRLVTCQRIAGVGRAAYMSKRIRMVN
jgi:lipopolysaccharide/colanic/teichoic acid biosynthesis glycosyltransferase